MFTFNPGDYNLSQTSDFAMPSIGQQSSVTNSGWNTSPLFSMTSNSVSSLNPSNPLGSLGLDFGSGAFSANSNSPLSYFMFDPSAGASTYQYLESMYGIHDLVASLDPFGTYASSGSNNASNQFISDDSSSKSHSTEETSSQSPVDSSQQSSPATDNSSSVPKNEKLASLDGTKPVPAPVVPASNTTTSTTPPENAVHVKKFGAVGDGKTDDGPAIQKAIDAAKSNGGTVWLPPGTYNHSGTITLDGAKMTGAGGQSVLNATNPDQSAIKLTGNGSSISGIKTTSNNAPNRSSMPDAAAVLVQGATNASVSNMIIQGASSNGLRLDGAASSNISGNLVLGTNADGIALMNGSTGNMVKGNVVNQAGDDSFSDNSYKGDATQDGGNTFDGNVSQNNAYGRGMALAGSKNDTVTNNIISGSKWYGIFADSDPDSGTMESSGHKISNNTVIDNPNGAPIQANSPGTSVSGTNTSGSLPDLKSILGWDPGVLPDRSSFNTSYTPGTGSGANNSGGVRT